MITIPVSKNTLINPMCLSAIETRKKSGKEIYVAIVDGKEYEIQDITQFMKDVQDFGVKLDHQYFAG